MWWGERRGGRSALLLMLQADALSLGWLAPASGTQAARWRSVQVPIQAGRAPPLPEETLATGAWRRQALREAFRATSGLLGQTPSAEALPVGLRMWCWRPRPG